MCSGEVVVAHAIALRIAQDVQQKYQRALHEHTEATTNRLKAEAKTRSQPNFDSIFSYR